MLQKIKQGPIFPPFNENPDSPSPGKILIEPQEMLDHVQEIDILKVFHCAFIKILNQN